MLGEALTWLTARCLPEARRYGHLAEVIAIAAREKRCRQAWATHLANSRAALIDSLGHCRNFRRAVVLGSGLLLDVPLAELAQRFKEVQLIDIAHLPAARRMAARFANVRCIEADLTGCLARLADTPAQNLAELLSAPPLPEADWLASVNLLSQLPLLPAAWLSKRHPQLDGETLATWRLEMMRQHLQRLAEFDGTTCVLADALQVTYDEQAEVLEKVDYATPLGLPTDAPRWRWDVAPLGEIASGVGRYHEVLAVAGWRYSG